MNLLRALLDAIRRRRLRRIAAHRLGTMLRRDGAVTIYVRHLAGVPFARRPIVATYRSGSSEHIAPHATRETVRRTA